MFCLKQRWILPGNEPVIWPVLHLMKGKKQWE